PNGSRPRAGPPARPPPRWPTRPPVREYRYGGTASRPQGYLYWLHTDTSPTNPPNRVNLAVATRTRAAGVFVIEPQFNGSRPALGVNIDGVVYFTVHGVSPGGNDMAGLVDRIRTRMATAGPNGTALNWVVMGDFNRDPDQLRPALNNYADGQFAVYDPPSPTHPSWRPASRYDYAVLPNAGNVPYVRSSTVLSTMRQSDHLPVVYDLGGLQGAAEPPELREQPDPPQVAALRNAGTTGVAAAAQSGDTIADAPFDPAHAQTWSLYAEPEFPGHYRLVSRVTGDYMGQEGGVRDAPVVQWPHEAADQLWQPVYQGDGTWTLQNLVTGQLLTAASEGAGLTALDPDGSAAQRWFLQSPEEMTDLAELGLEEATPVRFVADVEGGRTAENTPVILYPDSDAPNERFTRIPAGQSDGEDCDYLVYAGKYLNSTAAGVDPLSHNGVTLNSFRPGNDGYLWCQGGANGGIVLSNHSFQSRLAEERMYLTENGENNQLTIVSGTPSDVWRWLPVTQ
ncbi:RICIN domain-containing protein, partial [Nonomuraea sp. NPDC004297]